MLRANRATRARAIFNDEGLPEFSLQFVREDTRHDVRIAARGVWHDDGDLLVWPCRLRSEGRQADHQPEQTPDDGQTRPAFRELVNKAHVKSPMQRSCMDRAGFTILIERPSTAGPR